MGVDLAGVDFVGGHRYFFLVAKGLYIGLRIIICIRRDFPREFYPVYPGM